MGKLEVVCFLAVVSGGILILVSYYKLKGNDGFSLGVKSGPIRRSVVSEKPEKPREEEEDQEIIGPNAYMDRLIRVIYNFDPGWISDGSREKLELGEVGTSSKLASFLESRGYKTSTEVVVEGGKRADIIVDGKVIIEAKPTLRGAGNKGSLMSEFQMHSRYKDHYKLIVIYGRARSDVVNELRYGLKALTGEDIPIVVLGSVGRKYGG